MAYSQSLPRSASPAALGRQALHPELRRPGAPHTPEAGFRSVGAVRLPGGAGESAVSAAAACLRLPLGPPARPPLGALHAGGSRGAEVHAAAAAAVAAAAAAAETDRPGAAAATLSQLHAAAATAASSPAKGGGLRPGVGSTPRSAAPLPALRRDAGAGESARRLLGAHAPRALARARRRAWAGVGAAATQRAERGGGFPGGCPAAVAPRS